MRKRVIGVMGASANDGLDAAEKQRLRQSAEELGERSRMPIACW